MERFRRRVLTGLLTIIPLLITLWVLGFVLDLVVRSGRPLVRALAIAVRSRSEELSDLLIAPWFQSTLAVLIVVAILYGLGAATNMVIGRRVLRTFDRLIANIPFARVIYGSTRTLIDSFKSTPQQGGQRVVLIEFPTPEMRAVGFVTATFTAIDTGEEVAAVYVPTTPNPTSGYVEIVPTSRLVWLDWSTNDAMSFIVSGGAVAPRGIRMKPGAAPPPVTGPECL
jgi:uncharacterized membrane protein